MFKFLQAYLNKIKSNQQWLLFFIGMFIKKENKMAKETWRDTGIREKMQIINGTLLVFAAIALYFIAFIVTLTIGFEIISAGATLLGSGLAFFGITAFVKNQMVEFEAKVNNKIKRLEDIEQERKFEGYEK